VLCCARVLTDLQLLSELLLDVNNVRLMMRYVSDVQNLMQMMNMLKDTSRSIQFEAFHVFKVSNSQQDRG
jgi:calcium binding protein 39